jgi:methylase of polypeptide subunit release factors
MTFTHKIFRVAKNSDQCRGIIDRPRRDYYLDDENLDLPDEFVYGNTKIKYNQSMECGGIVRAPMFLDVLKIIDQERTYSNCLEWCSGPGFIGYSILEKGYCSTLDLADIWKPALRAAEGVETKKKATTWHIRRLSDIKPIKKYDLIVANPPWFTGQLLNQERTSCDPGLRITKQFFDDVRQYLSNDGIIIIVEGQTYTGPGDFDKMITKNGLELSNLFVCNDGIHWFMVIRHKTTD